MQFAPVLAMSGSGMSASLLGSSRLCGECRPSSRSTPLILTADQLLAAGPLGGVTSPQSKRYQQIVENQKKLMAAAETVVTEPLKLQSALKPLDNLSVSTKCLSQARAKLGQVVVSRVQGAFLEASLSAPGSQAREQRLKRLLDEVSWSAPMLQSCESHDSKELQRLQADAQALEAVSRARALRQEAQAFGEPSKSFVFPVKRAAATSAPRRQSQAIISDAMSMLRKWKNHSEVSHALCDALLTMASLGDFREEMCRQGLAVLASTLADIWVSRPEVARKALRLLGLMSIELLMDSTSSYLQTHGPMLCLALEVLNCLARSPSDLDDIARFGGRELVEDVNKSVFASNVIVALHALTLGRRLRQSKVKCIRPRLDVTLPPEDVVRIRGLFNAIDVDNSGSVSAGELDGVFKILGAKPNPQELEEALAEVDIDGSGMLGWPEFLFLMSRFNDGALSIEKKFMEQRLAELREVWAMFDVDGSGALDTKELRMIMRSIGLSPTEYELKAMIKAVDADDSGKIEWPEFLYMMSKKVAHPEEQHRHAFEFFDRDRLKRVQKVDFTKIMQELGCGMTEEALEDMFNLAKFEDPDMDSLTYKEFVKVMMR